MNAPTPYSLSPLELASGLVFRDAGRLPVRFPGTPAVTPKQALERAILPALGRPPCLVSFSGGRDSSAILAVATDLARREGLPLPIPATNRFPAADGAAETEWQERVIAHLGLEDWLRRDLRDELDCVGPVATRVLRRHGVLWPCNAHFHEPLFEAAAGGSLVTGVGGDEAFTSSSRSNYLGVLNGSRSPRPRDVLRVGFALAPRPIRRRVIERRFPAVSWWLRPDALKRVRVALAREAAREPLGWRARYRWVHGFHYLEVGIRSLAVLAHDHDVLDVHPFARPEFLRALAVLPRTARFDSRDAAMEALFGDVLPRELHTRSTKARFDGAFWTEHSRNLVERWQGEGVDPELVDLEILREVWKSTSPDARSFSLLQAVWLAREERRGRESGRDAVEQELDSLV
jgi:asparagine synthetase B (glutamine-hydrolysing)